MAAPVTLFDRFKTAVNRGNNLGLQLQQLQQQAALTQQAMSEAQGAVNILLEMDPTLGDQFNKEQAAAQKKAPEAPAKS